MSSWLKRLFSKYDLLGEYFATLRTTWIDVAFGAGIPALIFLIFWSLGTDIPRWAIVLFFFWAFFTAGYHNWRVDYVRLIPKLELGGIRVIKTPTTQIIGPVTRPGPDRVLAQILVKALTEVPIENCRGQLLRVWKWSDKAKGWKKTDVDEPQDLLWSIVDNPVRTIEVDRQLNLFHIDDLPQLAIVPEVQSLPNRMAAVFTGSEASAVFKFDISVTGKDSPRVETSFTVQMGTNWDAPNIARLHSGSLY